MSPVSVPPASSALAALAVLVPVKAVAGYSTPVRSNAATAIASSAVVTPVVVLAARAPAACAAPGKNWPATDITSPSGPMAAVASELKTSRPSARCTSCTVRSPRPLTDTMVTPCASASDSRHRSPCSVTKRWTVSSGDAPASPDSPAAGARRAMRFGSAVAWS